MLGGRNRICVVLLILAGLVLCLACRDGQGKLPSGPLPTATSVPVDTPTVPAAATPSNATPRHIVLGPGEPVTSTGALFYVDLATGATEGWELGLHDVVRTEVSPDGRYILTGGRLLDTTTGTICEVQGVSGWAGRFSPDGRQFLAETPTGVAKLTSETCGREREMTGLPLPGQGWTGEVFRSPGAAWSPDGKAVVIWARSDPTRDEPHGKEYVYLLSPEVDGPATTHLGSNDGSSLPVAWSPDGKRFALASGVVLGAFNLRGDLLWSTDIPGSSIANVRRSPDGRSLSVHAFPPPEDIEGQVYAGRYPAVYVLEAQTGAIRFRLWGASACWGELWTADGGSLIVVGQRADDFGWFIVTADGASVHRLDEADGAFFVEPSPTDPDVAAFLGRPTYLNGNVGPVEGPLMSLGLGSGTAEPVLSFSPEVQSPEWDPAHTPPRWLSDGRVVLFTGDGGHGGCEMGPGRPELEVQFPPFDIGE